MGRSKVFGTPLGSAWQFACCLGILGMVLAGCGGSDEEDAAERRPQTQKLVVAHPQEPPSWDYLKDSSTASRVVLVYNVVEPLLEKLEDESLEPLLAESFEVSDDGLTYLFTIREASFHDGSEVSADDVVYSLELNRKAPHGHVQAAFDAVDRIEKVDERTVRVILSRPSQRFVEGMSGDAGLIIPEDSVDQLSNQPIGSGPFVFGEWRPDVNVTLSRFDDYWGDTPFFEQVTWRFIPDETASLNALLAGEVDIVASVLGEGINRMATIDTTDGFSVTSTAGYEITYLVLNASLEQFKDERIRQAVAHAVDREAIIEAAFAGLGEPTCVFVNPPNVPWDSEHCPYAYDPDRAKELLTEANAEGFELEYKHLTVAEFPTIAEVVTSQLTDVGFRVKTVGRELATYFEEITAEEPAYELTNLSGAVQIDAWVCPGAFTQLCDPQTDELLERADAALSRDEYSRLRQEAVERHADLAYLIPVGNKDDVTAHRDDVDGVKTYRAQSEFDLRTLGWAD